MSTSLNSLKIIGIADDISTRWLQELQAPHRHYHTLAHISHIIQQASALADDHTEVQDHLREIYAAAWLHDIRYDATRNDNEEISAEIAKEDLKDTDVDIALVVDIIIDTKRHEGGKPVLNLFSDLDMSIIGSKIASYDHYMRAIRREYAHVPLLDYAKARAKVLRGFDARQIFKTPYFEKLEKPAHRNLVREITLLENDPAAVEG